MLSIYTASVEREIKLLNKKKIRLGNSHIELIHFETISMVTLLIHLYGRLRTGFSMRVRQTTIAVMSKTDASIW